MPVLWLKALHIIFMVTWFAGLFYLPRLFVYHAMTEDESTRAQFRIMERKLYYGIMNPGGVLTVLFGIWLWIGYGIGDQSLWLQLKIGLVIVLVGYHVCAAGWSSASRKKLTFTAISSTGGLTNFLS